MKVKITKEFQGVESGALYPRLYTVGEIVEGRLADVALAEGWGDELKAEETVKPTATVEIPDAWREFNAAETVALAAALGAIDIKTKAPAVEYIEAEVERRAAAAT